MKKTNFLVLALIALACTLLITSCSNSQQPDENTATDPSPEEVIQHGEYLVAIMGCNDCHSPKQVGPNGPELIPELMLSGFPADRPIVEFRDSMLKTGFAMFYPDLTAAAGPWGITFAANLTPDETGIAEWTEEQFKKALTQGKFKGMDGGRMLLPPMPWQNYKAMTDEDVHAVFMYLKSIKPVKNIVPAPVAPDNM